MRDRVFDLQRRLQSLAASIVPHYEEQARAAKDHEHATGLLRRIETLRDDVEASQGDPGLSGMLESDLNEIEEEVAQFLSDSPAARRFFASRPPAKEMRPVTAEDLGAYRKRRVVWRLGTLDLQHPRDWLREGDASALLDVLARMRDYERLTWSEVDTASRHNHPWEDIGEWERESRDRLAELELDDQDGWYQLHLERRGRLFGFRVGEVFNIVWWDRSHEVYRTRPG